MVQIISLGTLIIDMNTSHHRTVPLNHPSLINSEEILQFSEQEGLYMLDLPKT